MVYATALDLYKCTTKSKRKHEIFLFYSKFLLVGNNLFSISLLSLFTFNKKVFEKPSNILIVVAYIYYCRTADLVIDMKSEYNSYPTPFQEKIYRAKAN